MRSRYQEVEKHKCPHCGKPGIGAVRKHFIGRGLPARCKSCGGSVINHTLKSFIAIVPFVTGYAIGRSLEDVILSYVALGAGAVLMLLLTSFWVPLVKIK